ncbi:E3 ubiquitin-protein ligase rnf213-alpha [Geodia barretti]|uniref:E3 ubiquitin-protein ligase rnf213-alpha n=1 Tax=Geodia barretti TaxID=519541 RepID=A0AA35RT31_GEOBA|nr:E3 ubiquitin-protein ligase rnf213-alpha [Geodia barretti]
MDNIHNFGCYFIGGKGNVAMDTIHDVIHLTLIPGEEKELLKTSYNLDELRDLESKIVLITGSKAGNRAAVDHFLNTLHSVCRIAEVLIKLQQSGNVHYIGWKLGFTCQAVLVEKLQKQAKEMEKELEEWNREVALARKMFYELNYYTTRQLLVLRSGLKMSEPSANPHQWRQVKALLESISREITQTNLVNVVHDIAKKPLEDLEVDIHSPYLADMPVESVIEPSIGVASSPSLLLDEQLVTDARPTEANIPHVGLSKEDLNVEQKTHFTNILERIGYCELTALKAIEAVDGGDWNDIENWLEYNGGEWEEIFQEAQEGEEEEESEGSVIEDEGVETIFDDEAALTQAEIGNTLDADPSRALPANPSSSTQLRSRVIVTYHQNVDENNEEVQQLLEAEVGSVEECIRAIEVYGTADVAFNHIMELKEKGAIFQDSHLPIMPFVQENASAGAPQPGMTGTQDIIISVKNIGEQYLKLDELGLVLHQLSLNFPASVERERKITDLKRGQPHLLVVPPDQVLRAALSLYMEDSSLPLPTPEEMLICNQNTTSEEVDLLWQKAVCDPDFKRIFCLVHAEKLSYQTADKALRSLTEQIQNKGEFSLVIICSSQDEEKSPIISKLHLYRRPYGLSTDPTKYKEYLEKHFVNEAQPSYQHLLEMGMGSVHNLSALVVDQKGSCVRVISSTRAGMGKTLYVTRMKEKLQAVTPRHNSLITIPVHGPIVTVDSMIERLVQNEDSCDYSILHFDIPPSVLWQMDTVLFSLLINRGLCDSQGRVWRNHPSQLYAIEVTVSEAHENTPVPEHLVRKVLEILPTVTCVKPKDALSLMSLAVADSTKIVMDQKTFSSETFQRVYQYLRRHVANSNLDSFAFDHNNIEGTPHDCLQILLRFCGIKDPSWAEIRHFVTFLDLQLQSCERSYFTNPEFVGDVMDGFKSFVVRFMIQMSRDFSTSSLKGEVAQENEEPDDQEHDVLQQYEIVERKQWEHSSHPYLFFNRDGMSFTFVGFVVTNHGDLCDPTQRGRVIEKGIMTQQLYTGLKAQRVDLYEDYRQWPKDVMIQKISTVMGIEWPHDPDPTYVLTVDNLIKILAIQMRFRCSIPVVIMGETGCGKTRLIRFMCNLASQGSGQRNMLILKVHGGTTEKDIVRFLRKAEETAKENGSKKLDTVVFFDEANTTDAIGLIKEIMCDRRVHGHPVSEDLKFIAACNPYRRHTRDMIKKLCSAGLGFYVRETETQQKLGKIPLRELVYRVIDLPPSIRPLVYDFGQLNTDTERDYTTQIVHDHVGKHTILSQQNAGIIPAIARVLAWSQMYMRKREDECSFVSLRDVERAMIVFVYFFEKMALFMPLINRKEMVRYRFVYCENFILIFTGRSAEKCSCPPSWNTSSSYSIFGCYLSHSLPHSCCQCLLSCQT